MTFSSFKATRTTSEIFLQWHFIIGAVFVKHSKLSVPSSSSLIVQCKFTVSLFSNLTLRTASYPGGRYNFFLRISAVKSFSIAVFTLPKEMRPVHDMVVCWLAAGGVAEIWVMFVSAVDLSLKEAFF